MGFLRKLFGASAKVEQPGKTLEHKGYLITATPFKAGSGWQLAGEISKNGKVHNFIRADQFSDRGELEDIALKKGVLIVDQLGESMFNA